MNRRRKEKVITIIALLFVYQISNYCPQKQKSFNIYSIGITIWSDLNGPE